MIEVYVASAFSKNSSGGNRAGVVLNASDLSAEKKLRLAKKLGYSETAFVSSSDRADFKLDYYTPSEEVPLCGHATIATFVVLNSLEMLSHSSYRIETKAGILSITVNADGLIYMEQNSPRFYEILDKDSIRGCFDSDFVDKNLPIQIVSTGLRDILVPIDDLVNLGNLVPDSKIISDLSKNKEVVGIHAFSLVNDNYLTAICRNFAPLYGIEEEAATGTSNCALACYLYQYVRRMDQYIFEQGHNLDSISQIFVTINSQDDMITGVFVGGYGYLEGKQMLTFDSN